MSKFITLLLQDKIQKQISLKPYNSQLLTETISNKYPTKNSAFFWKVSLLHTF